MNKSVALSQIVKLLTLTAEYNKAGDIDRLMSGLSIIADIMEEAEIEPSDIEALITVQAPSDGSVVDSDPTPSLRERIQTMLDEAQSSDDEDDEDSDEEDESDDLEDDSTGGV